MKWRITIDIPEEEYNTWARELPKIMAARGVIVTSRWVDEAKPVKAATPQLNGQRYFKDDEVHEPRIYGHPEGNGPSRLWKAIFDGGDSESFTREMAEVYAQMLGYKVNSTNSMLQRLKKAGRVEVIRGTIWSGELRLRRQEGP